MPNVNVAAVEHLFEALKTEKYCQELAKKITGVKTHWRHMSLSKNVYVTVVTDKLSQNQYPLIVFGNTEFL